jgi:2-methylisocitrate lyase-like PEP mutase family enzyme
LTRQQHDKAAAFAALHAGPNAFVIPNPWDGGTARLLEQLGFQALTTTSAGLAFTLGKRDGSVGRAATMENARQIVNATKLPVAADLENGFGDSPEIVAETIRLAAETGLVGGSIEDSTGNSAQPVYDFDHAVERIAAACEAARQLNFPFVLVARAENFLHGRADLDDTIRRLQAFEAAGASALYAPGLPLANDLQAVCRSVSKPVNALVGTRGTDGHVLGVGELGELGARRVSLGSVLTRAAFGGFIRAARELRDKGTFSFMADAMPYSELTAAMEGTARTST